jgi:hypothetical protein
LRIGTNLVLETFLERPESGSEIRRPGSLARVCERVFPVEEWRVTRILRALPAASSNKLRARESGLVALSQSR